MAATVKVFDEFFYDLVTGVHGNLNSATLKVALSNTLPTKAGTTQLSEVTQISGTSNGYTPQTVTATWAETGAGTGVWRLGGTGSDCTFTQSGANAIGPFQYAVLYNETATNDEVIAMLDYGAAVTLPGGSGATFTVDAGSSGWVEFTTPAWS